MFPLTHSENRFASLHFFYMDFLLLDSLESLDSMTRGDRIYFLSTISTSFTDTQGISPAITAESSPLPRNSDRTGTRNEWLPRITGIL